MIEDQAGLRRTQVLSGTPDEFVSHNVMDRIPFIFGENRRFYVEWKRQLASRLKVDPYAILLTGSACVGFSLNPHKKLAPFRNSSDVDVAVVSPYHFDESWRFFRSMGSQILHLSPKERAAIDDHVKRLIYWGAIATDRILHLLPFAKAWYSGLQEMRSVDPTKDRDIKARVYKDLESLRSYQINTINKMRDNLLTPISRGYDAEIS